jgi:hypothetical protein
MYPSELVRADIVDKAQIEIKQAADLADIVKNLPNIDRSAFTWAANICRF